MYPSLDLSWAIEGLTLPLYFLAIMAGFCAGAWLMWQRVKAWGTINRREAIDFAIWMLFLGVVGSRIAHVVLDGFFLDYVHLCLDPMALQGRALGSLEPCVSNMQCFGAQQAGQAIGAICNATDGLCYPQADCLRPLKFWSGGLTVYGALLLCAGFACWGVKKKGLDLWRFMDAAAPSIFLGVAIGRLGCFASGCCYGEVCGDHVLGVQFPEGSLVYGHHLEAYTQQLAAQVAAAGDGARRSLPVWPTQLISSLYAFVIFLVGSVMLGRGRRFEGQVILVSVLLYGVCRVAIEFFRADFRGGAFGLSTSQWISLPLIVLGAWVLGQKWRASKTAK